MAYYPKKRIVSRTGQGEPESSDSLVGDDFVSMLEGLWSTMTNLGGSLVSWAEEREARIRYQMRESPYEQVQREQPERSEHPER